MALVVGAGVSGAILARMLAEAGQEVVVFEKAERVGGVSTASIDLLRIKDQRAMLWLTKRVRFYASAGDNYTRWAGVPAGGFAMMAEALLDYPAIHVYRMVDVSSIYDAPRYFAPYMFVCAPIDSVLNYSLGALAYDGVFPRRDSYSLARYEGYKSVLKSLGVVGFGSAAHYTIYSIEEIVRQAFYLVGRMI